MITKKHIEITNIEPTYLNIENKCTGKVSNYLSYVNVEFILFGNIICKMTNGDFSYLDIEYITNEIVKYINSKNQ